MWPLLSQSKYVLSRFNQIEMTELRMARERGGGGGGSRGRPEAEMSFIC